MPYDVNIGDGADALGQNQLTDALGGTYWVSGWDATLGTGDLEVDIAAGSGAVDGTDVSTASTQTIDFTGDPDSTDPRKAVIYVDSGGTVQKALGTPQPVDPSGEIRFRTYNPSPPASVSGVVVAEVWLAAGATSLVADDLRDRRVTNDASINATPNAPAWVEDANSPLVLNSETSGTITLANEYDAVKMIVLEGPEATVGNVRINGDSGNNYNIRLVDGSQKTDEDSIDLALTTGESNGQELQFAGYWNTNATGVVHAHSINSSAVNGWENTNVTSPLDSITVVSFDETTNISVTAKVYGLNR